MEMAPRMSLADKLRTERRSRLAAERLLELKQSELFAANRKLGQHAQQLSEEIVETRAEVESIRGENQRVMSDLSAANEKVEITQRRLWQSIETINDGFAFFNADNEMIMANRSYMGIFDGLEEVRPGVNYARILQLLTDEGIVNTGKLCPNTWRQMMLERLRENQPEPITIEYWNGSHTRLIDQRGPDGDLVSLAIDITTTVKYEKQLKEARAIAESANRAKSAFLANMSHEIRTPMNGVVGMADVLKDTPLTDEQHLYVETIRNSGEALLVIINDVLDYSKIEAKKLELHPEPFDLERTIQEILMLLQPSARAKGLTLALDYDLFLPSVIVGDPGRLRQVLTNLVGNAVKFTSEGHVLVRVTGVPDEDGNKIVLHLTVEDTGIGIPENMVQHIFGEFNQVENERNRQFDGTGLGLAITQRLVEMMGGQIWVTSEDGAGSCFGFKITLGLGPETAVVPSPSFPSLGQVVVVSEVEVIRSLLEQQLQQLKVDVRGYATPNEGLDGVEDTALIFVEEKMQQMHGMDFAQTLRAKGCEAPIVMLSPRPAELEKHPSRGIIQGILQAPTPRRDLLDLLTRFSSPQKKLTNTGQGNRPLKVLAAEDNKTNQLVFRKMIKSLNVDLTFANNGEEAIALYQSIDPDIVFMDISMPCMDGKEATRAIRAIEADTDTHVPIIAMTAHAMEGDSVGILAAGLDHYLSKPLRKPEIIAHIQEVHSEEMLSLYADG